MCCIQSSQDTHSSQTMQKLLFPTQEHSKNFQLSLPVLGFSIELKQLFLPVMLPLVACHKVVIYVESYPCRQKICQGIIIEM